MPRKESRLWHLRREPQVVSSFRLHTWQPRLPRLSVSGQSRREQHQSRPGALHVSPPRAAVRPQPRHGQPLGRPVHRRSPPAMPLACSRGSSKAHPQAAARDRRAEALRKGRSPLSWTSCAWLVYKKHKHLQATPTRRCRSSSPAAGGGRGSGEPPRPREGSCEERHSAGRGTICLITLDSQPQICLPIAEVLAVCASTSSEDVAGAANMQSCFRMLLREAAASLTCRSLVSLGV